MIKIINVELAQIYRRLRLVNVEVMRQILLELEDEPTRLDLLLLEKNLVTEDQNCRVYEKYFGIKSLDIDKVQTNPQAVKMVTQEFVIKNNILPFFIDENGIVFVAISDPFDYKFLSKIKGLFGNNYRLVIASKSKIQKIQSVVFSKALIATTIEEYKQSDELQSDKDDTKFEAQDIVNSPAVRLVESIIKESIAVKASDIHLEPFETTVKVRNRIDGTLYVSSTFSIDMYPSVSTRIKILAGINIAERRIPQDGRIKYNLNGVFYDFRVSTLPTVYGERIVIRILDTQSFAFTRDKLGFLDEENKKIDHMVNLPYGIILLTGPTGCGKSTTLYSFIQEISTKNINIITVEDPVEYTIEGVNQVQVNNKANMTFAAALRSILRQDPNVIMIGEIRDEETAEIAIRSAITGHLVFSTLHTNDAPGAVTRLVDMGVEPYFVSDALSGVIAQRLVRKLCPHCRKGKQTTKSEMKILGIDTPQRIYHPVGCPACNNTGYNGRLGIHEIFEMDDDIRELIQKGAGTEELRKRAKENGMLSLKDTCAHAVLNGETSINELLDVIFDIDE